MVQRQLRTKSELEELRLMALQGHLGLNHLDHVEIGPYSGSESWTWRVLGAAEYCLPGPERSRRHGPGVSRKF